MLSQNQWIDLYKAYASISTDYKLAQEWGIDSSRISQYRKNRLRLTFAQCIKIADTMEINPLEILASLEYERAREEEKEFVKNVYFDALVLTIGERMSARATSGAWHKERSRWKGRKFR